MVWAVELETAHRRGYEEGYKQGKHDLLTEQALSQSKRASPDRLFYSLLVFVGLTLIAGMVFGQDLTPRTIDTQTTNLACRLAQAGDGDSMCFVGVELGVVLGCVDVAGGDTVRMDVPIPAAMLSTVRCITRRADGVVSTTSLNMVEVTSTVPIGGGMLLPPTVEE